MPVDAGKSFGWCSLPSGVLPDMLSAETPSGTEETYPAERTFLLTAIDNVYIHNSLYFKLINF